MSASRQDAALLICWLSPGNHKHMPKSDKRGLARVFAAAAFSAAGLRAAWQNEEAFRQESVLAIILAPVAIWLGQSGMQRGVLLASLLFVLVVELLNSAIEAVVDRIGHDLHELSGQAKDMGSAAVLLSIALMIVIWGGVAWDRFGSAL
jgi:diacylglycerol kinase (ATP)